MNLQQFAALKKGDKIEVPANGSKGEVSRTVDSGVFVVWGERSPNEREFFYTAVGTSWFSWERA